MEKDTSWLWLMISQGTLEWNSLKKSRRHATRWKDYAKSSKMKKGVPIVKIKSDHGKEFENAKFKAFCIEHNLKKEFSAPKTPQ